jgi:hypothetical protein
MGLLNDEILGEYFGEVLGEKPFNTERYDQFNFELDGLELAWYEGWIEAVEEFWEEVAERLDR